jgi:hypothetical protein
MCFLRHLSVCRYCRRFSDNRDSVFIYQLGCKMGECGIVVRFPASQALGPMQTSILGNHSPVLRPLGHEGDRAPRSSTEVKIAWMSTATPSHNFMAEQE